VVHLRDEGLQRLPNGDICPKGFVEQRIVLTFDLDFGEVLAGSAGQVVSVVLFRLHDTRTDHVIERLQTVLDLSSSGLLAGVRRTSKEMLRPPDLRDFDVEPHTF
jgi:predicted nuclease of predicted toxin-antitoxin system